MKTSNFIWMVAALAIFAFAILFPGGLSDIPNWAWAIAGAAFIAFCLADLARNRQLKAFATRGGIALLLFVSFVTLIQIIAGEPAAGTSFPWNLALLIGPLTVVIIIGLRGGHFKKALYELRGPPARPTVCASCGVVTKVTHFLDETWRGRFAGSQRYVCSDCLRNQLSTLLTRLQSTCALAEPSSKPKRYHNAYYAYTNSGDDIAIASGAVDADDVQSALSALERIRHRATGSCEACGNDLSNVAWIPGAQFGDSWTEFDLARIAKRSNGLQPLCGGCAAQSIVHALDDKNIRLDEIWAPVDGTVLMFSGES